MRHRLALWLTALALLQLVLAERVLSLEQHALWAHRAVWLGWWVVAVALRWRALRRTRDPGHRQANRLLLAAQAALLGAGIAYVVASMGRMYGEAWAWGVGGSLGALGLLPMLLLERAQRSPMMSAWRAELLATSGVAMVLPVLGFLVAHDTLRAHDTVVELAYARAASPGAATRALASGMQERLEVVAFMEPDAPLSEPLRSYFAQLEGVKFAQRDQLLEPALARDFGVRHNGVLAFGVRGADQELARVQRMELGERGVAARATQRDLDRLIHRALRPLARRRKRILLLAGHEEASWQSGRGLHRRLVSLREQLGPDLNVEFESYGTADGLPGGIPEGTGAVMLLDPQRPYLAQEVDALMGYLDAGGAILVALEPNRAQVHASLAPLLGKLGVRMGEGGLASLRHILPMTRSEADRVNLIARDFEPHPAVATLANPATRAPVLFPGAGYLEALVMPAGALAVAPEVLIRAPAGAWADVDGDLRFSAQKETRREYTLAVAVAPRARAGSESEGGKIWRAVVLSDASCLGDLAMEQSAGNMKMARDLLNWLLDEQAISGGFESEQDVRLVRDREQEAWLFYATTLGAPLGLLLVGFALVGRRQREDEA